MASDVKQKKSLQPMSPRPNVKYAQTILNDLESPKTSLNDLESLKTSLNDPESPWPESPWRSAQGDIPEQFAVIVTCRDEEQQVELLRRFHQDGLECQALL